MASDRLVIPEKLTAGDTWQWDLRLDDYSPVDYRLKLSLRGAKSLDITATADNGEFLLTAAGSATSALTAGTYAWVAAVFDADNNRFEIARGTVEVLADIMAADVAQEGAYDGRSAAQMILDAIDAVIQKRATRMEKQYSIGGRMLQLMDHDELIRARGYWANVVRQEKIAAGQLSPKTNSLKVRFGGCA